MRTVSLIVALLAGTLAPCAIAEPWKSDILMQSEHGMGGAAIGDLDPDAPGNEVAVVNDVGEVWLVRRTDGEWKSERIYAGKGELIMCAIGDVDSGHPGNELVGVGMVEGPESREGSGQVVMIWKDGDKWSSRAIFQDDHMIHGVAVGDVSTRHVGNEVITGGFNHRVQLLHQNGTSWEHETIYVANDRLKIALAADIFPDRPGLEVVVTGSDGRPQVLWEGKLGWHHQTIYVDHLGQSRVAAGKGGVLIGGDGGKVTLASHKDGRWQADLLGRDTAKMRGVVLGDVDPNSPGEEAYACGYSGNVTQFVRTSDDYWRSQLLYSDGHPLHYLLAGEFDPEHPGPELLTCGHAGRLVELYRDK